MDVTVSRIDPVTAPQQLLVEMHRYYLGYDAELWPDDPPMPVENRLARWRNHSRDRKVDWWILRENDEIVGSALAVLNQEEDLDKAYVRVHVSPERRRRGLARLLAAPLFDHLEANGRHNLIADSVDGSPWESKLEGLGLKKAFGDRQSRLITADIDWDLMDGWISRAADRGSDYEMLPLSCPIPDEHVQKWCDLMLVMNTAPREDLEFDDFTMTPERWREIECSDQGRGNQLEAMVAVHRPSGEWVGLSEIVFQANFPEHALQGDTGVRPDHRNKGLGRWLKAAMIRRFMETHPEVERIDTENAGSNEPMLNINVEMGYKPLLASNAWQGDLATVRSRLGV